MTGDNKISEAVDACLAAATAEIERRQFLRVAEFIEEDQPAPRPRKACVRLADSRFTGHRVEVIANEGRLPLLGVGLLMARRLTIDYGSKELILE